MVYQSGKKLILGAFSIWALLLFAAWMAYGQGGERSFNVPEECSCIELFSPGTLSSDTQYKVRQYGNGIPAITIGPVSILLSGDIEGGAKLPIDDTYSDIRWFGTQFFYAGEGGLYYCENSGEKHLLIGSEEMISEFGMSEEGIFFTVKQGLFFLTYGSDSLQCCFLGSQPISHLSVIEDGCFFSEGKEIFAFGRGSVAKLFSAESDILAIAGHNSGMVFYGTADGVHCITPDFQEADIVSSPVRNLDIVGDDLFITFADASCVMITDISYFYK